MDDPLDKYLKFAFLTNVGKTSDHLDNGFENDCLEICGQ